MLLLGAGARPLVPGDHDAGHVRRDAARTPGLLSGLVNTTQQVGAALGLAVLATLATSRSESLLAGGDGQAAALTGGYTLAFASPPASSSPPSRSPSSCCGGRAPRRGGAARRAGARPTRRPRRSRGPASRVVPRLPQRAIVRSPCRCRSSSRSCGALQPERSRVRGVVEHDLHVEVRQVDGAVLVGGRAGRAAGLARTAAAGGRSARRRARRARRPSRRPRR